MKWTGPTRRGMVAAAKWTVAIRAANAAAAAAAAAATPTAWAAQQEGEDASVTAPSHACAAAAL